MPAPYITITFRMTPEFCEEIDQAAKVRYMSRTAFITAALGEYLKELKDPSYPQRADPTDFSYLKKIGGKG